MKRRKLFAVLRGMVIAFFAIFIMPLVLFPFWVVFFGEPFEKSYHFPLVAVEAEVLPDGSMLVSEHRTFKFKGSFSWAEQWVFYRPGQTFYNLLISEESHPYQFSESGEPGHYYGWVDDEKMTVVWYYRARNEERTFTLSYWLDPAVTLHRDVAELYWKVIGDDWETGTDLATVLITLPGEVPDGELLAWGHGPLHGAVDIIGRNRVQYRVEHLPGDRFLEARLVFPLELVPDGWNYSGRTALPDILAEEKEWTARAGWERLWALIQTTLGTLPVLFAPLFSVHIWKKYHREYKPRFNAPYLREVPAAVSPAALGMFWYRGKICNQFFIATILDLARRGYLRLEKVNPAGSGTSRNDYRVQLWQKSDLQPGAHEQCLLDFLKKVGAGGDSFLLSQISHYIHRNSSEAVRFYTDWERYLKKLNYSYGFYEENSGRTKTVLTGSAFFLAAVFFAYNGLNAIGMGLLTGSLILFATIPLVWNPRHSREGIEQRFQWRAFRRFLLNFSTLDQAEIPSLAIWEHYLVYAVVLGVAGKVIRQLELVYPQLEEQGRAFVFRPLLLGAGSGAGSAALSSSLKGFSTGVRETFLTARSITISSRSGSSYSSGGGGGGGFSSGGGGGFGGGGGRAG